MKVVQISSPNFQTPPIDYGGTQREVYYLTNQLIEMGHEVILYGKKGSSCKGDVIEYPENCKSILSFVLDTLPKDVDLIHDHIGDIAEAKLNIPTLCSIHTRRARRKIQFPVYVSEAVLKEKANGKGFYVHNGILLEDYAFETNKDNYLLFLGRLNENKGAHIAIEVAKTLKIPLILAGPIQKDGKKYFKEKIEPHIDGQLISYVGPVGGERKIDLIKKAKCVLFPITWFEPFGLVPIEAMACGTPVVCFRKGGVNETMKGFPQLVCNKVEEMIAIVNKDEYPSPLDLRNYVRQNFSIEATTEKYLNIYEKVLKEYKYR